MNEEINPDFSEADTVLKDRHTRLPTSDDISGPTWSPYPDGSTPGQFRHLILTLDHRKYIIPVSNLNHPERDELWDVQRVFIHNDRLRLEVHLNTDEIVIMTEAGLTQDEDIYYDREHLLQPIEPDGPILWTRTD